MTSVDPERFRIVIGQFVTGVAVMTTWHGGEPHGMTANAVSSVSLDPVLVLVCVDHAAEMRRLVRESQVFALSVLAADQRDIADQFADPDRPTGAGMFEGTTTTTDVTGSPLLDGSLAYVDCRVWAVHPGGDHDIVVGEVCGLGLRHPGGAALTYHLSAYGGTERG